MADEWKAGFDVVKESPKTRGGLGAVYRCKQCQKLTPSNWGLARRHFANHQKEAQTQSTEA